MPNESKAEHTRQWTLVVLGLGILCLLPTALATWAYYAHIWDGIVNSFAEYVPLLLTMTPIYASLVGEPLLVVAGAIHVLTHDEPSAPGPRMILTGGAFIAGWSTFAMALWPPDVPVRVVIGVMAAASIVIIGAGLRLRRRGGEVSA